MDKKKSGTPQTSFKARMAELVLHSNRNVSDLAKELGVSVAMVEQWKKEFRIEVKSAKPQRQAVVQPTKPTKISLTKQKRAKRTSSNQVSVQKPLAKFIPKPRSAAEIKVARAVKSSTGSSSVNVSFDPSPVKTGYTIPFDSSTLKKVVTATCTPASDAGAITFDVGGEVRVSVNIVSSDTSSGQIVLNVKATGTPTPANSPNGDTTIFAYYKGNTVGQVQAIVVIPASVGTPHPQPNGPVIGKNLALNEKTSPTVCGLDQTQVFLESNWSQWLPVIVFDQFNHTLDPIYTGAPVAEGCPINQNMRADGTYLDPVGVGATAPPPVTVPANSNRANDWVTIDPLDTLPNVTQDASVPVVTVGGHQLNPAVVNRKVTASGTNIAANVAISWP